MSSIRWFWTLLAACTVACSSASVPNTGPGNDAATRDSPMGDSAAGTTTWNSYAKGFFATYCVSCHNASTPQANQNFNVYADVKGLDSTIRCGVSPKGDLQSGCPEDGGFPPPGQFPIGTGPYPADADRLRIVAWIKAGAPEN